MAEDYADVIQSLMPAKSAAKAGMLGGPAAPAQKALAISQETGIPAPTVLSDPDLFGEEAKRRQAARVIESDDKLAKFFAANPVAGQAAQDDMPSVGLFSSALSTLQTGWRKGQLEERRGSIGFQREFGGSQEEEELRTIDEELKRLGEPTSWLDKMGQMIGGIGGGISEHVGPGFAGAAVGSVFPAIGTSTGAMAGIGAGMGRTAAGRWYLDSKNMQSSDGKPINEAVRIGMGLLIGVANSAANVVGMKVGGEAIGRAIGFGIEEAVVRDPTVRTAIGRAVGEMAKGSAQGGAIIGSLAGVTELLTDIAKTISPGEWATIFNDPKRRAEALKTVSEQTIDAMTLFAGLHVPAAGRSAIVDSYRIRRAAQDAAAFDAANEAAKGTPFVKGQSESVLNALIEHHTEGQQVGIPIDAIERRLAADPKAFDWAPEIAAQLEHARATGDDVEVPLSKVITAAPDPLKAELRDEMRFRREGFTVTEAKELTENSPVYDAAAEPRKADLGVRDSVVEEARRERKALWLDPLFRPDEQTKTPLGMTTPEYAAYSKKLEQLQAAIELKAEKAAERDVARRLKPEWKAELERIQAEVDRSIRRRSDHEADSYFRSGELSDGEVPKEARFKLDAQAVEAILGSRDQLPRGYAVDRGGVHPDAIAELFGYNSGQKMLEDLMALHRERQLKKETPSKQLNRRIREETERRMEEIHGRLDERIREEALDMVAQRAQTEVLGAELEFLAKGQQIDRDALTARTHELFATLPLSKARDHKGFLGLVAKAGRAAELALLKGDSAAAFLAKQRQYQALLMASSSKPLARDFERLAKTFDRFRQKTLATVDQAYTDQIHRIMYDLEMPLRRDPLELARAVADRPLNEFVAVKELERGEGTLPVADFLINADSMPVFRESPASPRKEFTVEQFHALKDSIDVLVHAGTEEKKIRLGEQKLELDAAVAEAHARFADLPTKSNPLDPNVFDAAKGVGRGWDVALLKMEQIFQWFDKNDPTGVFTKLFQRFASAKYAAHDMTMELGKQFKELRGDRKFRDSLDNKLENTSLRDWHSGELLPLNGHDLLGLMLHIGNASNFEKLTSEFSFRGQTYRLDPADVLGFIQKHATKEHARIVQAIWDINENFFWPKVEEMYRRVTGIAPDKIEARPIKLELKGGEVTLRGGYVPLDRDPRWPHRGGDPGRGLFAEQRGRNALPPKGYTMARNGEPYPVSFDFLHVVNGMRETIHDLAYREVLIDAKKFLDRKEIRDDITATFGKEYTDVLDPWLEHVATSRVLNARELSMIDRAARFMRHRLVATELVGRWITLAKHTGMATLDSFGEIARQEGFVKGTAGLLWEMAKLYGNPLDTPRKINEIFARSGELRTRWHQFDRDLISMSERLILGQGSKRDAIAWAINIPIASLDQMTAIPVFLIAERRAIERGMSLSEAAAYADTVVRNAHGSQGTPDLAPILRGNEAYKLLTVAYNSFNHNYNRVRNIGREIAEGSRDIAEGNLAEGFGKYYKATIMSMYYIVLLAMYERWVTHSGPDKDKDEGFGHWLAMGLIHQNLGNFPLIREFGQMGLAAIEGKQFPTGTPVTSFFRAIIDASKDVYKVKEGEEPSSNWVSHFARGVGYTTGVPGMGQVAVTSQFLYDLSIGRQQAEDTGQMIRGVVSGKADPHVKIGR